MADKSLEMIKLAYNAADDKKGENIKVLDIHGVSVIADYFLIVSGNSLNQVNAIRDNIEEVLGRAGYFTKRVEGNQHSGWILMDYGDIVVHVFTNEDRLFYDLERIWKDAKVVEI